MIRPQRTVRLTLAPPTPAAGTAGNFGAVATAGAAAAADETAAAANAWRPAAQRPGTSHRDPRLQSAHAAAENSGLLAPTLMPAAAVAVPPSYEIALPPAAAGGAAAVQQPTSPAPSLSATEAASPPPAPQQPPLPRLVLLDEASEQHQAAQQLQQRIAQLQRALAAAEAAAVAAHGQAIRERHIDIHARAMMDVLTRQVSHRICSSTFLYDTESGLFAVNMSCAARSPHDGPCDGESHLCRPSTWPCAMCTPRRSCLLSKQASMP